MFMSDYDFERDLQDERFEDVFANWLRDFRNVSEEDIEVSSGYFPEWDVKADGVTYEVKRDYVFEKSGNLLIELYFNKEEGKKGWFFHTEADKLVVFVSDNVFYWVDMSEVRLRMNRDESIWSVKEIRQDEGFTTVNWVADIGEFDVSFYEIPEGRLDDSCF